ncbi:MAG: hypothetical protein JZU60_03710 [Ilumatobacteraceae bacterium]|nr:hypothetical protein [Ilumatobacteraceae bacterium]
MADLNALIAQGYQFQAPPDPFANYAKMQQLNQGEQTNQLNRMKMQEYQRGMDETNAMRRLDPTSPTYLQDITRINPKTGFEFAKIQQEAGTARTEGQIKSTKLIADKLALLPEAYRMADTPEAYLALHRSVHADPVLGPYLQSVGATPEKGLATLQKAVDTGTFEDLRMNSMQSVSQILESMKPQVVAPSASVYQGGKFTQAPAAPEKAAAVPTSVAEYELSQTDPAFMKFLQARSAANRAPATPAQPSAPVQVIDPVTGKPVFVSRDEALRGRMTPAAAQESLSPKEIQKREAVLPQATSAIKGFESKSDSFIKDLEKLRDDPGLNQITGAIYGRTGSVTREGSRAQALYDKIVAKGGFQALQDMRDASKTGGALGNVSNTEGKQLQASVAAIDRRQSSQDVKDALDQLIGDIQGSKARMREAYDSTYSYKSNAPGAAPAAPAAPNIDALLNKYK